MSQVINKNRTACQLQFSSNVLVRARVIRNDMKITPLSNWLTIAGLAAGMTCGTAARATTTPAAPLVHPAGTSQDGFLFVGFRDSAEAEMLRNAYRTLATGDHDYRGHRVKAMRAVEAAGKLLGLDLAGDLRERTPQPLSDEKLREAQSQITQVLGSAEVRGQKRVVKHLNTAIQHINTALSIR